MDERKKYAAFSIPQRETGPAAGASPPVQTGSASDISFTASGFAEIEIDESFSRTTAGETAMRFFSTVTPAQPIKERAADPIRQKFFDMRSLASDKPFSRNDSELFYKQAKFMEDFSDDYEGEAKFFMYYPYYQHMGYEQLRTYFTWRARVRRGEIQRTTVSYVFLYIYELLSGIGVSDPADGLDKLIAIWDAFAQHEPALENYFPRWIRDYHIYYELPHSFEDFVREHGLQKYYSLMFILDTEDKDSLELWNNISGYDVTRSRFFNDGNEQLLQLCFSAVLSGIGEFCAGRGSRIEDMLIYRVSNRTPWYPFRQALFYNWLDQPDRKIKMPGQERFFCQSNRWTASLPIYYSTQKDFAGYIIKKTESCLRQAVKYKHKLSADLKTGRGAFRELKDIDAEIQDLDTVIEKAVVEFHRDLTRTVVTVDHTNLARIRREAQGTQEKLIVPEERDVFIAEMESGIRNTEAGDESDKAIGTDTLDPAGGDDPWDALKNALDAVELQALSIILSGGAGIKAFADEKGIMIEVLADGINEKAADFIGDNILEITDGMTLYDEYRGNVEKMVM